MKFIFSENRSAGLRDEESGHKRLMEFQVVWDLLFLDKIDF